MPPPFPSEDGNLNCRRSPKIRHTTPQTSLGSCKLWLARLRTATASSYRAMAAVTPVPSTRPPAIPAAAVGSSHLRRRSTSRSSTIRDLILTATRSASPYTDNDDGSLIFDFTRLLRSPPRKDAATMNGSATSAKEEETEPQPVPKPEPQPQTEHQPDTESVIPSWKDMYMGGDATDGGCGDVGVSSSMLEEIWETSQLERQRADDDESREEDQLLLLHALTSELGSPPQGQDTAVPELLDESNRTGSSASSGRSDVGSPPIAVVEAMDESMATAVMKWSDDMLTPAVFEESDDEIGDDCEESEGAESSIELDFDRIDDGFDETFLISLPRLGELELFGNPVADPRNDCEEYDVTAERILSLPWSEATGHHHHPTINHQHFNVFPTPTATLPSSQPSTPPRNPTFSTLPPTQIQAQTVTNLFATPLPNQMTPPPTFVTSFHAPSQITWSSPCWKASALTVLHGDVVSDTPASSLSMGRKRVNEAFLLEAPQSSPEGLLGILQQCQGGEEVGCVVSADVSPCGSVMSFGGGSVGMGFVGEEDWLVGV
ncbi:hypothetical protein BC938DRAFT_472104 [Jimgerdemannia flammicorona]|uniref:Uncharacterized protein n=1 Tax=Jimgerdemannia flammicorona TaxID=994334 RepID=A0A433QU51_9FUNG|nr:hypothetical protein BC938DRAFT_472104 [Jimgerdemannia flammicorona]